VYIFKKMSVMGKIFLDFHRMTDGNKRVYWERITKGTLSAHDVKG